MVQVYFATGNPKKIVTVRQPFLERGIRLSHFPFEMNEPDTNVEHIAITKAEQAFIKAGGKKSVIVQDTGFFIRALNNFPAHRAHRALKDETIESIHQRVIHSKGPREAEFKHALAFMAPGMKKPICFVGILKGKIPDQLAPVLANYRWSGWWRMFKPDGFDKALSEMTPEERKRMWKIKGNKSEVELFANWFKKYRHRQAQVKTVKRKVLKGLNALRAIQKR